MKIVQRLINPAIRDMQAYHVPDNAGLTKLDAMENPYHWPPELVELWLAGLRQVSVNRYPSPDAAPVIEKLREVMQIPPELGILLGNGSDELIQLIAIALAGTDRTILTPEPGFVMYRQVSQYMNLQFRGILLKSDDFSLDREAMLEAIDCYQPALIFIAYPNNPTGNLFNRDDIIDIISTASGLVVIDEAYHAFSGESFISLLHEYENLLVMRTLSKSGLAGLRLGYLTGQKSWLDELNKVRLPYNINTLTQLTTAFILDHYDVFKTQARQICTDRALLFQELQSMDSITVWPGQANFLLFRCETMKARQLHDALRNYGILIKCLDGSHPLLKQCLRVTVGKPEENAGFIKALKTIMRG